MQEISILGIDISKAKFDVCLMVGDKTRSKVFTNNQEGFEKLEAWCKYQGANLMHTCQEATGYYGEELAYFMHDKGHKVSVVNPMQIKSFGKSELLRNKTDKADAKVIARFCKANNPRVWQPKPTEVRELRDLLRCINGLKEQRVLNSNQLENKSINKIARQSIESVIAELDKQIKYLEDQMKEHIDSYPKIKKPVEMISAIKGIGFWTAVTIIVEMPEVCNFTNARQFAAYVGLNPAHRQSGSSIKGKTRISKIGSARVRKALYLPAIVVKQHNIYFKDFCHRLACKGKKPKEIVVAIMRKLIHIFFGMLKNNQEFNPEMMVGMHNR